VLVEEARTNLCLYSDDFTNAAWVKSNLTAAKTATGPDGVANSASTLTATAANATAQQDITSASAARITSMFVKRRTGTGAVTLSQGQTTGSELVTNGGFATDTTGWTGSGATLSWSGGRMVVTADAAATCSGYQAVTGLTPGALYKISGIAKKLDANSSYARIFVYDTAPSSFLITALTSSTTAGVEVDSSGIFAAPADGGISIACLLLSPTGVGAQGEFDNITVTAVVETTVTVTSSWTRVATASATVTNPSVIVKLATSGDAIDVALFQIENGAFITSPIATVASQVTRAADNITILTSAFPYSATAGTFAVEADSTPILTSTAMSLFSVTTADNDLTTLYFANTVTDSRLLIYDAAGALQVLLDDDVVPVSDQMKKLAFAFAANDVAFVGQGGAVKTDNSVTLGAPTTLKIGGNRSSSVTQSINGHIKRLAYYAVRKDNSTLQVLST
jgi:hypothetical protein